MSDSTTLGATLGTAISPGLGTVIGAGLGGLANVVSGLLGSSSAEKNVEKTNKMNYQIAQETNQLNRQMFDDQLAYQSDMWEKTNAYNSPQSQVQRLLAAGINPAAVFGSGSVSEASTLSSPSPNAAVAAHMQSYDPSENYRSIGRGISDSINSYFVNDATRAAAQKTIADTARVKGMTPYEIDHLKKMAQNEGVAGQLARTELEYQMAIQGQRISQSFNETRIQDSQLKDLSLMQEQHDLQNKLIQVQLAYAPDLNKAQLNQYYATVQQLKASVGLIHANTMLTEQQRLSEVERRVGYIIDNGLKGFDYTLKNELHDVVIQNENNKAEILDFERRNQKSGERLRRLLSAIPFVNGYNKSLDYFFNP